MSEWCFFFFLSHHINIILFQVLLSLSRGQRSWGGSGGAPPLNSFSPCCMRQPGCQYHGMFEHTLRCPRDQSSSGHSCRYVPSGPVPGSVPAEVDLCFNVVGLINMDWIKRPTWAFQLGRQVSARVYKGITPSLPLFPPPSPSLLLPSPLLPPPSPPLSFPSFPFYFSFLLSLSLPFPMVRKQTGLPLSPLGLCGHMAWNGQEFVSII